MRDELLNELRERIHRFLDTGDPDSVLSDNARHLVERLWDCVPDPASDLEVLHAFGWVHWCGYLALPEGEHQEHLGDAALRYFEPVHRVFPDSVPDAVRNVLANPDYFAARGKELLEDALNNDDRVAFDSAVDFLEHALAVGGPEHPDRGLHLSWLGVALQARFKLSGTMEDLHRAIDVCQQSVDAGHPERSGHLSNLGLALQARFELSGTMEDLDRAIDVCEQSVDDTPPGHPDRPGRLSNLGVALQARFKHSGTMEDLDRAIDVYAEAVDGPSGDPARSVYLSDLGLALAARFGHIGAAEDVNRAVDVGWQAVETTPAGHPNRPRHLFNLAGALVARFERSGAAKDLNGAIDLYKQAVDATPRDHPDMNLRLAQLAAALQVRFERFGAMDDLDRAIDHSEQAVAAIPHGRADRGLCLCNLGAALQARFERSGAMDDLDRAIDIGQQAVDAIPHGHTDRVLCLSNLGLAVRARFERTGALEDIDRAIDLGQQAVDSIAPNHPDRAVHLFNLGNALQARFQHTARAQDVDHAVRVFQEATTVPSARADVRTRAAQQWGRAAAAGDQWVEAVEGFGTAVDLVGLVGSRELGRDDQEFRLGELRRLGPEAAAACVQAGQLGRAVELFEQGRGVLFSQMLDARSDLTSLEEAHPDLAIRFVRWRDVLDRRDPGSSRAQAADIEPEVAARLAADRRWDAAAEFDRVLGEIRAQHGFERFLSPRPVQELLPAAAQGPVVLLSVAPLRSDALILTPDRVEVVPLEGADLASVIDKTNIFVAALSAVHNPAAPQAARTAAEMALGSVLGWLGDRVTGPVLDRLGYASTKPVGAPWPRVWWCPSGALSLLPMHAAGHHEVTDRPSDAVIDRVISSTVPTVRTLLHVRQAPLSAGEPRMLVVAMPHTPGQADLPGVADEAAFLEHFLAGRVDVLGLPGTAAATYDTVTAALPDHRWVHFSCHGESDLTDPSASALLLADYRTRPLTVVDLTEASLQGVELAFLSACTTARTGTGLLDEPIHLAAACQLAGYRHVVASLWPIGDADTAWLTERFYTILDTTTPSTADASATALHLATRRLRALNRTRPSLWAPYTHTGP
jgi:tetratricopeptide (TPR) repeat protein